MTTHQRAFSLVEVLAAVAIIGVITFLALPNIIAVKQDSETSLAIARAEAANIALVNYVQSYGRANATSTYNAKTTPQARYSEIAPFLAFAPADEASFMPSGYSLTWWTTINTISKVQLNGPGGIITY
jgi:prepilin-type N-terminal cleavage/methylation domain-containing protein